ncbi:MAG: GHMP kinase, partial [Nitrosopumilus sp.]|nr:GHMP kinase [Nitrosopumilus sp.]
MEAMAFCPAHITGFFKAHLEDSHNVLENLGSMGAGFSIKEGVTTKVRTDTRKNQESRFRITTNGYQSDKTDVSEYVLNEFLKLGDFSNKFIDIE